MPDEITTAPGIENPANKLAKRSFYKWGTIVLLITAGIAIGRYLTGERAIVAQQASVNRRSGGGAQSIPVLAVKAKTGD
ncbi:MAG TPA: hypothetical protein VMO00_14505, partial [Methylomirabilota bacterium]|nr:hypothetical protein [Methylomirabilota bacterium]